MWEVFDKTLARYHELEQQLADPALIADRSRYTQAAKEHGSLAKQVKPYREFQKVRDDIKQLEALLAAESDPDMRRYYEEELAGLKPQHQALQSRLEDLLLVEPGQDF